MTNEDRQKIHELMLELDRVEVGKWFRLRPGDRDLIRYLIKLTEKPDD